MGSKRNAQYLDAQNFLYELNQKWIRENYELKKHLAENGKDTKYYTLLGIQEGVKEAIEMADAFVAGSYRVEH